MVFRGWHTRPSHICCYWTPTRFSAAADAYLHPLVRAYDGKQHISRYSQARNEQEDEELAARQAAADRQRPQIDSDPRTTILELYALRSPGLLCPRTRQLAPVAAHAQRTTRSRITHHDSVDDKKTAFQETGRRGFPAAPQALASCVSQAEDPVTLSRRSHRAHAAATEASDIYTSQGSR